MLMQLQMSQDLVFWYGLKIVLCPFSIFYIQGHAQALARNQKAEVGFVIHNLPVIAKMAAVGKACGNMFQLAQGNSAETSGGLLICLPREQAAAYCKDIQKVEGYQAWIIGIVEKGNR